MYQEWKRGEQRTKFWYKNLTGRNFFEDLDSREKDNIERGSMRKFGLGSSGSGEEPLAESCECSYEHSGSIK
jgi:hypothetical protein